MPDSLRLSQGKQLLGLGGGRRERPLAVNILPCGDHCSGEPGVFGARRQNYNKIDVRLTDERLLIVEGSRDIEFSRCLFRGFLFAARYRNDLEVAQRLEGRNVPVLGPTARTDNSDA